VSTLLVVAGWAWFMSSDSFATIWGMFGVANQMLAVIALAVVSAWLVREGRARYLWVTVVPMMVIIITTSTAALQMLTGHVRGIRAQLDLGPEARGADPGAAAHAEAMRRGQDPVRRDQGAGAEIDALVAARAGQSGDEGIAQCVRGTAAGQGGVALRKGGSRGGQRGGKQEKAGLISSG
jgi:hypothetical protein